MALRLRPRDPERAQAYEGWLATFEGAFQAQILPVTTEIADRWGRLGAPRSLPAVDTLMAATALVHGLTLVTRDVDDVEGTGVAVLNPFAP